MIPNRVTADSEAAGQAVLAPIIRGTDNLLPECLRNTEHDGHRLAFCRSRTPAAAYNEPDATRMSNGSRAVRVPVCSRGLLFRRDVNDSPRTVLSTRSGK